MKKCMNMQQIILTSSNYFQIIMIDKNDILRRWIDVKRKNRIESLIIKIEEKINSGTF